MSERRAACCCGQLTAVAVGEPVRVSMCHCTACQRRTGSPFGAQARFPTESVRISGESTVYVRTGESGAPIEFHFCPRCGSTVYYRQDHAPELIAIPVGAFADATFPPPQFSVYEARRHPWTHVPEGAERMD